MYSSRGSSDATKLLFSPININLNPVMQPNSLDHIRDGLELITFDCYGTLVDWETGIRSAIRDISGRDDPALFDAYVETEAQVEAEPYRPYRDVTADALRRVAHRFGFNVALGREHAIAHSLPDWPVWPDTNPALARLKRRYRIGILSNIDRDLIAQTMQRFTVEIDLLVTAEDVRAYKPAHAHFERMLADRGGRREGLLHAAQSWFHDCVPATRLNIPHVWINRRSEPPGPDAHPSATFPNLTLFADALDS